MTGTLSLIPATPALAGFLQRCHDWEENDDPDARQLPRAKRHDDKATATIRLA